MPGNLPSLVIKRHLRGRNGNEKGGSLGKDFFLSTDFIVRLDASASGEIALSEFDPGVNTFKHPFSERRVASDPIDGILFDNVRRSRDARVYDAVGSLTANLAQAAKVVVTDNNGSVREYEIIDTRIATSARFARLVRQLNPNGMALQALTYRYPASATLAELGSDPARLWQISTVGAADGTSASFTYDDSRQRGWKYGVSRIVLPNGSAMGFTYQGDVLTSIALPDGTAATFTTTYDTVLQKNKIVIRDPGAEPGHQFKTVWWTYDTYTKADGSTVAQTYGQLARIDLGNGELAAASWWGGGEGITYY